MHLSPMNAHPSSLHAAALEAHRRLVLSRCRLWAESTVLLEDKPARGGCSLLHSSTPWCTPVPLQMLYIAFLWHRREARACLLILQQRTN